MRRGATLAELLVALTLAGLVLGTASRSVLLQQRTARHLAGSASADAQSRGASELLRAQLSAADPKAGDLSSEQSDTALQLRAPVALGVVCASSAGVVAVSVDDRENSSIGVTFSPPRAGDSLWWYPGGGSPWVGRRLSNASTGEDECRPLGTAAAPSLRLQLASVDTVPPGTPARITRQLRYDLYRGSDGRWYLGSRDWSDAMHRFAPPQPIAGPFIRQAPNGEWTGFAFFDENDLELPAVNRASDAARVARIRLTLWSGGAVTQALGDDVRRELIEVAVRGHGPI
jgi:hypothetical protein